MSGTTHINPDAELVPSKADIAQRFALIDDISGSYRLADPAGDVGLEILVGSDPGRRLNQLALTYRDQPVSDEVLLCTMQHSDLGERYVSNALGDPVAVTELIRTIIQGDDGAIIEGGGAATFTIKGTGTEPDADVKEAQIAETTRQRAVGTVTVNGEVRLFQLRFYSLPQHLHGKAPELGLLLKPADAPEDEAPYVAAELVWSQY